MTDSSTSGSYQGLNRERTLDLAGASWEEYLLYVLEVDREYVNEDGLTEIANVFRSLQSENDQ